MKQTFILWRNKIRKLGKDKTFVVVILGYFSFPLYSSSSASLLHSPYLFHVFSQRDHQNSKNAPKPSIPFSLLVIPFYIVPPST